MTFDAFERYAYIFYDVSSRFGPYVLRSSKLMLTDGTITPSAWPYTRETSLCRTVVSFITLEISCHSFAVLRFGIWD